VINANLKKKLANVGVKHQSINHKIPRFPQKINQRGNDLTATEKLLPLSDIWNYFRFTNKISYFIGNGSTVD
jgi:hypothetical protein